MINIISVELNRYIWMNEFEFFKIKKDPLRHLLLAKYEDHGI